MPEMIEIDVPRRGIGSDLTEALAAHGCARRSSRARTAAACA